jgi:hypothetical protein
LETLQRIRKKLGKPTQPMIKTTPRPSLLMEREQAAIDAVQLSNPSQQTNTSGHERKVCGCVVQWLLGALSLGLVGLQCLLLLVSMLLAQADSSCVWPG